MSQTKLSERMQSDTTTEPPGHRPGGSVDASSRTALGWRFWRLFAGNTISSVGDGLVVVAFPLLALSLTTRPVLIAGVAIAGRLPALLFSIPAGALVDRVDRRRLVVLINVVRMAALAVFAGAV